MKNKLFNIYKPCLVFEKFKGKIKEKKSKMKEKSEEKILKVGKLLFLFL